MHNEYTDVLFIDGYQIFSYTQPVGLNRDSRLNQKECGNSGEQLI